MDDDTNETTNEGEAVRSGAAASYAAPIPFPPLLPGILPVPLVYYDRRRPGQRTVQRTTTVYRGGFNIVTIY